MNPLERQLAALLAEAPGEPPNTVDPDEVLARVPRRRRRYIAPALAAAAVIALGITVAIAFGSGSGDKPVAGNLPSVPSAPGVQPPSPRAAAIRAADTIIATAPVLPGAARKAEPPLAVLDQPDSIPGAQHVQRTAFWTAPGDVAAALAYYKSHPPTDMHASGSSSGAGPDRPSTSSLYFAADEFRSVQFTLAPFDGGVAVRADAQVLWAPSRATADMVPAPVTSVEVTVVRKNPQAHQGAPTVQRTLTDDAARALADFVNSMSRAVRTGYVSCPAMLGGEQWSDTLVFHSGDVTTRVVDDMRGCATITFQTRDRKPIELAGALNSVVLRALGLPTNYGHAR